MAKGNRAAIRIEPLAVKVQIAITRDHLCRKGFVQLDWRTAETGPIPITRGSTAATVASTIRAIGFRPSSSD